MGTIVTLNGVSHTIPANGESGWGTAVTNYLVALASGVLQKAGGSFTLTADADFGATFGLKSLYLKSRATNVAAAGVMRLGNAETLSWRNAANSADLALTANASNILTYAGNPVVTLALGAASTALRMNAGGTAYEWAALTNVNIDAAAAIAYSKLNLATSIVNADVAVAAAIVDTKLATIATALKVSNSATTAASANTASAIVARDGSGNFTAGTITAALTGNASGTAANVTGIVAAANGGTGQTTANAALNALLPAQSGHANKVLTSDATNTSWTAVATAVTTTRGDMIRRGASADERFAAVTNNRVVRGNGTDVVLGQVDDPSFFTTGAAAGASAIGIVTTAAQTLAGAKTFSSAIVVGGNTTGDSNLGTPTSVSFGDFYQGTFSVNLDTGMNTSNTTFTVTYQKIGKEVTLRWPSQKVTSVAGATKQWSASLTATVPSSLRPAVVTYIPITTIATNVSVGGLAALGADGSFEIQNLLNWPTSTANCGFQNVYITYLTA